jgi:hypothetical protein
MGGKTWLFGLLFRLPVGRPDWEFGAASGLFKKK